VLDADQAQRHKALSEEFPTFTFVLSTAPDVQTKPREANA
jgi:hypothetical protein